MTADVEIPQKNLLKMNSLNKPLAAPDLVVVRCEIEIDKSVNAAWSRIGAFGDAGRFLPVTCELIRGDGGIGSVRQVGDAILEVMVGKAEHSYCYVQTQGPSAALNYHGCVALETVRPDGAHLVYTLVYDQSSIDVQQREAQFDHFKGRFDGAVKAMKTFAESSV